MICGDNKQISRQYVYEFPYVYVFCMCIGYVHICTYEYNKYLLTVSARNDEMNELFARLYLVSASHTTKQLNNIVEKYTHTHSSNL